jgi:hypothetical protein
MEPMSDQFDVYHLWLGIPPEEQPPNHYRLLGLRPFEDNLDVISNAADQRRSHLRTFQTGKRSAQSQQLLNEVSAACICLLDPVKKLQYDAELRGSMAPAPFESANGPAATILPVIPAEASAASAVEPVVDLPGKPVAPKESNSAGEQRNTSVVLLLLVPIAIAAACLVFVAAGVGIWWFGRGTRPEISRRTEASPAAGVMSSPGPILPTSGETRTTRPTATDPPPSRPKPSGFVVPPVAPQPSSAPQSPPVLRPPMQQRPPRIAWLPAGEAGYAIRNVEGRWIEYRETSQFGFDAGPSNPAFVQVNDRLRGMELRLFNDRLELKTPRQEWAILDRGRWVAEQDLPAYARRPPQANSATTLTRAMANAHALVFCGKESVRIPVPREIQAPNAAFTMEAWLRVDRFEPQGILWATDNGSLEVSTRNVLHVGASTATLIGLTQSGRRDAQQHLLKSETWTHVAIARSGDALQLYLGGRPLIRTTLPPNFALPANLNLGAPEGGMCGIVRDFRISSGARYSAPFTPEVKLPADGTTLALLQMRAAKAEIPDASGRGHNAENRGARWIPLSPFAQLAAELGDGAVDLLQAFAIDTEVLQGSVWKEPRGVETRSGGVVRMLIPYRPPAEYDLEAKIERTKQSAGGEGGAFIGLSIAGRPAILLLDAHIDGGKRTGILPADLSLVNSSTTLQTESSPLLKNDSTTITIKVRLSGNAGYSVTVESPGQAQATFSGQLAELEAPSEFQLPTRYGMSLGSWDAHLRFTDLVLRPVSERLPPQMLAQIGQTNSGGNANPSPIQPLGRPPAPANPGRVSPPAAPASAPPILAARKPLPAAAELTAKIAEARAIYQEEFRQATKAAQKAALAKDIESDSAGTRNDATARYVLIDLARKVYIQAGEVEDALRLARLLESEYEVPPRDLLVSTLKALDDATIVPEQRAPFAEAAADLADELLAAGQYERADELSALASQAANRQKNVELKKAMVERRTNIARIVKQYAAVKTHFMTLAGAPADPAANLAVGKFRCLALEDWPAGLPQLAASEDGLFSAAAKLDLKADQGDAPARLQAAEAWLALVDTNKAGDKDDKLAIQRRAKGLLNGALSGLSGLDKVKAQKRLDALENVGIARPRSNARSSPAGSKPAAGGANAGLIGRVSVNNADAGVLIHYEPGYRIDQDDVARLTAALSGSENIRVELWGVLQLEGDQTVAVHHAGGSAGGGVHTLQIDNQTISDVGDDRSKNLTTTMNLRRGPHLVHWTLTGGDLGTAEFKIAPASGDAAGQALPIAPDRSMEAGARAFPTRTTMRFGASE